MSNAPSLRGQELKTFKQDGGRAVASDVGTKPAQVALTTGIKDAETATLQEKEKADTKAVAVGGSGGASRDDALAPEERAKQIAKDEGRLNDDGTENPPGAMPNKEADKLQPRESESRRPLLPYPGVQRKETDPATVPSWFAIGWTSRDRTLFLSPTEAEEHSILADFLNDMYYGQWYHNAGIIVFAVVASHFVTLFGGGFGWLIIVMAVCATYYELSIKRVRRNARDDLAREVAKKGLKTDVESAAWINSFSTFAACHSVACSKVFYPDKSQLTCRCRSAVQRFWLIYEPVLSATIVRSAFVPTQG